MTDNSPNKYGQIKDAIVDGSNKFDRLVDNGSFPHAAAHDRAICIVVALEDYGFQIVRAPKRKRVSS